MNITITFADGYQHLLHPEDINLLKGTGLEKLLTKEDVYLPRYGRTFPAFMHFIYGYPLSASYIRRISRGISSAEFLEMMLIDNRVYKIEGIRLPIVSILYDIDPNMLDKDTMMVVFSKKPEAEKKEHRKLVEDINTLELQIAEILDEKPEQTIVFEWMPLRKLQKMHIRLMNKLDYHKFRDNMRSRLPYMFIGLVEMISEHTNRPLSENYKKNIKTRLRSDEGIILELYSHMRKTGITHTTQTILSVLTNLFIG
jgi:hypothetical protein